MTDLKAIVAAVERFESAACYYQRSGDPTDRNAKRTALLALIEGVLAERDEAQTVAAAASKFMVAFTSDDSCFDEEDELAAALKPWRESRAASLAATDEVPHG